MRRRSWPALLAGALVSLVAAGARPADAAGSGARLGVRAGYADLGGAAFGRSLGSGEERLFGLQAIFPLVTDRILLQVVGEGSSEELEFSAGGVRSAAGGRVAWSDLALYTSLRVELLPAAVFGLYGGGGVGVHFVELDAEELGAALGEVDPGATGQTSSTDSEWHGLAGATLDVASTFEIFAEGRYRRIDGALDRDGWAAYAGLNLPLP